jgi:hypothetical protein
MAITFDKTVAYNRQLADWYFKIHVDRIYQPPVHKYIIVGDRVEESKQVVVHTFSVGDVEDPDLYAGHPLWEWQESEQGKWVMENSLEPPVWHRNTDAITFSHKYAITAKLTGPALTAWLLKQTT